MSPATARLNAGLLLVINNLNVRGNGEGGAGEASDLSWVDLDGERAGNCECVQVRK